MIAIQDGADRFEQGWANKLAFNPHLGTNNGTAEWYKVKSSIRKYTFQTSAFINNFPIQFHYYASVDGMPL